MPLNVTGTPPPPPLKTGDVSNRAYKTKANQKDQKHDERVQATQGVVQVGAFIAVASGQYADAATVKHYGPPLMNELVTLADNGNSMATGIVDFLTNTGPFAGLIAIGLPMVMQFAANHRFMNADKLVAMGMVQDPDGLAATVKAEMAEQAAQALIEQKEAQARLSQAQAAMNGASAS